MHNSYYSNSIATTVEKYYCRKGSGLSRGVYTTLASSSVSLYMTSKVHNKREKRVSNVLYPVLNVCRKSRLECNNWRMLYVCSLCTDIWIYSPLTFNTFFFLLLCTLDDMNGAIGGWKLHHRKVVALLSIWHSTNLSHECDKFVCQVKATGDSFLMNYSWATKA